MTDTTHLDSVRQVLTRHKEAILKSYRAVGVGIGKQTPTDQKYVIIVYLEWPHEQPKGTNCIEGVPLKFVVTGRIRRLTQFLSSAASCLGSRRLGSITSLNSGEASR